MVTKEELLGVDSGLPFEVLKGETITKIESTFSEIKNAPSNDGLITGRDSVVIHTASGKVYEMWHGQDSSEKVYLADVDGDWKDLIGSPILMAEKVTSDLEQEDDENPFGDTLYKVWTFYKLATIKGYVTLRWIGESNGYYSVEVIFK
jgi:hypothetical protein